MKLFFIRKNRFPFFLSSKYWVRGSGIKSGYGIREKILMKNSVKILMNFRSYHTTACIITEISLIIQP